MPNCYIVTVQAEFSQMYFAEDPPAEADIVADAEEDGLKNVEVLSITEVDIERAN